MTNRSERCGTAANPFRSSLGCLFSDLDSHSVSRRVAPVPIPSSFLPQSSLSSLLLLFSSDLASPFCFLLFRLCSMFSNLDRLFFFPLGQMLPAYFSSTMPCSSHAFVTEQLCYYSVSAVKVSPSFAYILQHFDSAFNQCSILCFNVA